MSDVVDVLAKPEGFDRLVARRDVRQRRPVVLFTRFPIPRTAAPATLCRVFFDHVLGAELLKLRLGIVGSGDHWAQRHRPALQTLQDRFDVRAVFSPTVRRAVNVASEFQADVVDGYRTMVRRSDIDAVLVLERSWLGWLPMLAAAEAGKAIYLGGPCDFDPRGDESVRASIDRSGVSMMVEFPRRYAPATLRLKELIATRLGNPSLIICDRRLSSDASDDADVALRHRGEMIELIDWCRYVVGGLPTHVHSVGHEADEGHRDYQSLTLRFDPDPEKPSASFQPSTDSDTSSAAPVQPIVARLTCGSYLGPQWPESVAFQCPSAMQICCQRGIAFIDLPGSIVWFDQAGRHMENLESETPVGQRLLSQFHRAATSLLRNVGDLNDAFEAARIYAAALQSEADACQVSGPFVSPNG